MNHQAVEIMQNKKCHSEENPHYKSIINSDCVHTIDEQGLLNRI